MISGSQFLDTLRVVKSEVYFMGQRIESVPDHPATRPHANSAAVTYDLAMDPEYSDLASATSHLTGHRINRFTHVPQNQEDLVKKVKLMRLVGQITGACFQRCVGLDAMSALSSVTYDIDQKHGTCYHERLKSFLIETQDRDLMSCGAMTDPKGNRSKHPHEQHDPDLFVRVVERRSDGIVVRGAKMHQTGAVNSHQFIVLPCQSMTPADRDYAVAFAVPADAPGLIQVLGRQVNDSRKWEGRIDQGNATYGIVGGEALVIFDNVFVPYDHVFMLGETEFASSIVARFTAYHRQNYGACKSGNLDVLIGATQLVADIQGTAGASHIKDKLTEMAHMVETMYSGALACSYVCSHHCCGTALPHLLMANTAKLNTARLYPEVARLAQDIAGGFVATLPSERELDNPRVGSFIRKYYQTRSDVPAEDRIRLGRLIENMTGATPIIECMHGAGSPQAQKVVLQRLFDWEARRRMARRITGIQASE